MKLILVTGVIGSGKDYYVQKYQEEHPDELVVHMKFAGALRTIAAESFGEELWDDDIYEKWKAIEDNRMFLINLGVSLKKNISEDIFANILVKQFLRYAKHITTDNITLIISDFRFPIEFESICCHWDLIDRFEEVNVQVVLVDYKSPRYAIKKNQVSELMAIWLIEQGYKHGTVWDEDGFVKVMNEYLYGKNN